MIKVSNEILKNREKITYFEKKVMKYVVLVVLLTYVVTKNLGSLDQTKSAQRSYYSSFDPV